MPTLQIFITNNFPWNTLAHYFPKSGHFLVYLKPELFSSFLQSLTLYAVSKLFQMEIKLNINVCGNCVNSLTMAQWLCQWLIGG